MSTNAENCPHCGGPGGPNWTEGSPCPQCGEPGGAPASVGPAASGPEPAPALPGPAPARRWARRALVAGLALVAIGGSAAVIYPIARDELAHVQWAVKKKAEQAPPAEVVANSTPDKPDIGEVRTPLMVLRAPGDGKSRPVVALGRPSGPTARAVTDVAQQRTLARELVRQGLLVAARDELGLETRDEVLDDGPLPKDAGMRMGEPLVLATLFRQGSTWAAVRRDDEGKTAPLLALGLGEDPYSIQYEGIFSRRAEEHTRGAFLKFLRSLGLDGRANAYRADAPVPAALEKAVEGLNFVEAYGAVRALHALMRKDGESPARLSALARGYAMLGALSEHQWSPAHRAFKARALLYSERLRARLGKVPEAFWPVVYVRALVGIHFQALGNLKAARELARKRPGAHPEPDWMPAIEAYLKSQTGKLEEDQNGPHAKLALFLRMLALERPVLRVGANATWDVLKVDAGCQRAWDAMCDEGNLSELHRATTASADIFTRLFPIKLKAVASLPKGVRDAIEKDQDEIELVAALARENAPGRDAGEPSCGALAHWERETRFVQAWRRLRFMVDRWNVPAREYWEDVAPFVKGHRYAAYLQSFVLPAGRGREALANMMEGFDPTGLEVSQWELSERLKTFDVEPNEALNWAIFSNCLSSARDHVLISEHFTGPGKAAMPERALRMSPYSAPAMGLIAYRDWALAEKKLPEWLEKVGPAPALTIYLGLGALERRRYRDAEKYLKLWAERSPDENAFDKLAECYRARGNLEAWKKTLDDYLNRTENTGLGHANVQVKLANYHMDRGEWAEAKRYAEPAAETWAGWAMLCAARANEGLEDWERAELWTRRTSERYPSTSWDHWVLFCLRTGHGDLEAARAFCDDYLDAIEAQHRPDLVNPNAVAFYRWSTGDVKPALAQFEKYFQEKPSQYNAALVMLAAAESGDRKRRDEMLKEICTTFKDQGPKTAECCGIIRDWLAASGRGAGDDKAKGEGNGEGKSKSKGEGRSKGENGGPPLDVKAIDKVLDSIAPDRRGGPTAFLVGRLLFDLGEIEPARKYLTLCARSPNTFLWMSVLAEATARDRAAGRAASK